MPLKINGTTIPWSLVTSAVIAIFWLSGLSFQVAANGESLKTHVPEDQAQTAEIRERLAKIEAHQEATKEDVDEIKSEQKDQSDKLDRILEAVRESG
jgi:predicted nuclease with TOPRIM domain